MRFKPTGLAAWWVQRASALYMLLFLVFVLASLAFYPGPTHAQWAAWVSHPAASLAIVAFFASLFSHMWVGLRDVLLDYARPARLQMFLLAAMAALLLVMTLWVLVIFVRVHS